MYQLIIAINNDLDFYFDNDMYIDLEFDSMDKAKQYCIDYIDKAIDNLYTYDDVNRYNAVVDILTIARDSIVSKGYYAAQHGNWHFYFEIENINNN